MCFAFPFFFRRWLIHAKCLTVPALHSEGGIRSPLMCRVFLEIPKNQFKRFSLDTTPPAYVKVKARLPRRLAGRKHLVVASFPSVLSCADHGFSDFSLSWWSKEGIKQRKMAS